MVCIIFVFAFISERVSGCFTQVKESRNASWSFTCLPLSTGWLWWPKAPPPHPFNQKLPCVICVELSNIVTTTLLFFIAVFFYAHVSFLFSGDFLCATSDLANDWHIFSVSLWTHTFLEMTHLLFFCSEFIIFFPIYLL